MNIENYFKNYTPFLENTNLFGKLESLSASISSLNKTGNKILLAGNGASASIASHLATDFSKQAHVRAIAFNDCNLITALGNDCGYENWIAKALDFYADKGDMLILISSSGKSKNVVSAAQRGKELGLYVASFTGFAQDNPLGQESDINFWVDSRSYNIIECVHMIWLTSVVDILIGTSEYSVSA